jgi:CubicO group peptidase (beta-lactamase class C family)
MSGAGYLRSTLRDMTRFLVSNMEPASTALSDALRMAQTLQADGPSIGTGVGLGWEIDRVGTKSERLYKGGSTYGFTSYISFQRDGSQGFVLLTNGMYAGNLVPHMLTILGADR